jgi:hypothetical protein
MRKAVSGVICVSPGKITCELAKSFIAERTAAFAQGEIPDILEDVSRIRRYRQKTQN